MSLTMSEAADPLIGELLVDVEVLESMCCVDVWCWFRVDTTHLSSSRPLSRRNGHARVRRSIGKDRWFDEAWQAIERKPLERRTLRFGAAGAPRGVLSFWVDVLPRADAQRGPPPLEIGPPAKIECEPRRGLRHCRRPAARQLCDRRG